MYFLEGNIIRRYTRCHEIYNCLYIHLYVCLSVWTIRSWELL